MEGIGNDKGIEETEFKRRKRGREGLRQRCFVLVLRLVGIMGDGADRHLH